MFDHVEFTVSDISAAYAFYAPIFTAIGAEVAFFDVGAGELGIEMGGVTAFLITEGKATKPHLHICFKATGKKVVETAYQGAITGGGRCNGGPGYRDHYEPGYYAAYVFDPDGHNIEILFREPQC
ncbi:Glyoxalase-like domain protein [Tritonibacter multivorans]|uniref:Glyoxalase-like domain protein n=1 Tax=Tritonibacter multivorans TaxID=928856 RepID=A0A0P1G9V3_9RHOB|nr:VOC family protein [Tritonibacter multivorans]MDA7421281.1 VOC family protein [Tritonibacter multivorans]CUH78316.1 Glyoxalase-like domain protein [Tritonibacter multivorans]SFD70959.1 Predicted lactoylglutathione lyase [Tritonibacter multivorans]